MADVVIDGRWNGTHGISRYASEVIPRLTTPHRLWTSRIKPASPGDSFNPARVVLSREALLYSPGFSAGVSRCRQLLTLHDLLHFRGQGPRAALQRSYYDRIVKPAIQRAGHVMTVSETSKSKLAAWLDDPSVTIHVTGEGASSTFVSEGERATFDRPYFLYVGNFKSHKNPVTFFEALSQLPGHRCVVVSGDGAKAKALAERFDLTDRFTLLSGVDDSELARLYRGAQALVFPSLVEGFGLPPLEALKCGCPVVFLAECESVAEICADGPGAVDSLEPRDWAHAMAEASSPSQRQMRNADRHQWTNAAQAIDSAMQEMLGRD